ncbi:hypothetical protein BU15DRAFT_47786 [Melanogaster broomeanus]|nr:hypothetical protein BU15DRAFT_47786 [Melanogaster broomeanus]
MAPSKETSCEGRLPITPSSPIRIVANLIGKLSSQDTAHTTLEPSESTASMHSEIESLIQKLQNTSLSGLMTGEQVTSKTHLQHGITCPISPMNKSTPLSPDFNPTTTNEAYLLTLLCESDAMNISLKRCVIELQATNVLNEMYCNMLRGQLVKQEEKKQKRKGKLMGDGLPRLLSSDEFYEKVVACEEEQKKAVAEKKSRKIEKNENKVRRVEYQAAMERWKEAKVKARAEKTKFNEPQSHLGKLMQAIPRPAVNAQEEDGDGGDSSGEEIVLDENEESSDED